MFLSQHKLIQTITPQCLSLMLPLNAFFVLVTLSCQRLLKKNQTKQTKTKRETKTKTNERRTKERKRPKKKKMKVQEKENGKEVKNEKKSSDL